jgi:hypothetical protein
VVLFEELRHVDHEVADHRQSGQRFDDNRLLQIREFGDAGKTVLAVDVHRIRTADPFTARPAQ